MKVALFVACFIDAFFAEVGIAALEPLERVGVEVDYPLNQTCCGQPLANSGDQADAALVEALFVENFKGYEYIVGPSGSCTHHVRENLDAIPQTDEVREVRSWCYELVEFLHDVLKVEEFPWAEFPGFSRGSSRVGSRNDSKQKQEKRNEEHLRRYGDDCSAGAGRLCHHKGRFRDRGQRKYCL